MGGVHRREPLAPFTMLSSALMHARCNHCIMDPPVRRQGPRTSRSPSFSIRGGKSSALLQPPSPPRPGTDLGSIVRNGRRVQSRPRWPRGRPTGSRAAHTHLSSALPVRPIPVFRPPAQGRSSPRRSPNCLLCCLTFQSVVFSSAPSGLAERGEGGRPGSECRRRGAMDETGRLAARP